MLSKYPFFCKYIIEKCIMNTYLRFFVCVGVAKSSKFASKFGVNDIQDIVSPRSIKKELAASQSIPKSKGMITRAKGRNNRK
ncbi:hypothetical protein Hanom_Chr10g00909341 [Helianthus anomalus]